MNALKIGVCGLGTVAQGVLKVLATNQQQIAAQAGRAIEVRRVASRTPKPEIDLLGASFSTDLRSLITDPDIDVVVELIGGETAAFELMRDALQAGKSVVTANKAVLATRGDELLELAVQKGADLTFEAAVAGGIPIISALSRSLAGNRIEWLAGIINGTSNYILTAMAKQGRSFEEALAAAQKLGYAEADPTFDVEGIDAAHKLTIMAALAFGIGFRFEDIYCEGISEVTVEDIEYARQLGYQIKHLGIARARDAGVELRVHPTLVPDQQLLASVNGVMNAIVVHGNAAGDTLYYGAGAAALPTASAVVADLIDIARGQAVDPAVYRQRDACKVASIDEVESGFYLRIPSLDKPGVFAQVATILSQHDISIEAAIQKEQAVHLENQEPWVPIIILTEEIRESVVAQAIEAVQRLPQVVGKVRCMRVEHFN